MTQGRPAVPQLSPGTRPSMGRDERREETIDGRRGERDQWPSAGYN